MALSFKEKKMSDAQIFQVFSIAYISIGIGFLINSDFYKKLFEDFAERTSMLYFGGMFALVIGYLIVAFHNTWTKDFSVIITVVGWISLAKGILILVWPKLMIAITKAILKSKNFLKIEVIAIIIIGLFFSFLGFCPKSPI